MTIGDGIALANLVLTGALALTAILALWFARGQLTAAARSAEAARQANEQGVLQAKGSFLFALDSMWEGAEFREARVSFEELHEEVRKTVPDHKPDAQHLAEIEEKFTEKLADLRKTDVNKYSKLMQLCGFFETTGQIVRNDYIPLADIIGLYEVSILRTNNAFRSHIHKRRAEPGAQTLYDNFHWLARETEKVIAARR